VLPSWGVPCVASLEALQRTVAGFGAGDLSLVTEPVALAAARRSLDESSLLLLGEVHGVRENPLVICAVMREFGLSRLALEWPGELAPVVGAFLAGAGLADHPALWLGDGRITAGHLAVLRERAAAGPLELILFDDAVEAGWSWSQRDEAMARRILADAPAGTRTLAVAGNAHTPTGPTSLGVPMGACLARHRPGVREMRISYGAGHYYNLGPRSFGGRAGPPGRRARLHLERGALAIDLPTAGEAVVPHRPYPAPAPGSP
jgi:hypothetical protein